MNFLGSNEDIKSHHFVTEQQSSEEIVDKEILHFKKK